MIAQGGTILLSLYLEDENQITQQQPTFILGRLIYEPTLLCVSSSAGRANLARSLDSIKWLPLFGNWRRRRRQLDRGRVA